MNGAKDFEKRRDNTLYIKEIDSTIDNEKEKTHTLTCECKFRSNGNLISF